MGWILGVVGALDGNELTARAQSLHPAARHQVRTPHLYLAAGGAGETTLHHSLSATDGWFVLGLGLRIEGERTRILDTVDWSPLMDRMEGAAREVDGHYLLIRYSDGGVEVRTDRLGLRTLYIARAGEATIFSTRLDWVARFSGNTDIDFGVFGSRWLLFNQLSTASPVCGIRRLGPGGFARLHGDRIQVAEVPWIPPPTPSSGGSMEKTLAALANPVVPNGGVLLLGLSGGLDSRLLLSFLLACRANLQILAYGARDHPDVRIASLIARRLDLPFDLIEPVVPPRDTILEAVREYQNHLGAAEPASSFLKAMYAHQLAGRNLVLIDGGFGEISRRQYLNRLVAFGQSAISSGEPKRILPFLSVRRGNFLSADVRRVMEQGALHDIAGVWRAMPPVDTMGPEGFADLLAVHTRFPNFGAMEQSRLDTLLPSYTPFAQPSMLRSIFETDALHRRGGRLWREFIRRNMPVLMTFPLVKGDVTYPFRLGPLSARIWTGVAARLQGGARPAVRDRLLQALHEPIMDMLSSQSVREAGVYDLTVLTATAQQYYAGRMEKGKEIDWWLAMETWRRGIAGR